MYKSNQDKAGGNIEKYFSAFFYNNNYRELTCIQQAFSTGKPVGQHSR